MGHQPGNVRQRRAFAWLLAVPLLFCTARQGLARDLTAAVAMTGLHVQGSQIVNGAGASVLLHGVNRSGAEYACIQGWGFFDGPVDAASVQAIVAWHVNAVRVPLNEDCWLGINGVNPAYGGANYQQAIGSFVSTLSDAGLAVILDLHWAAPGTQPATYQLPMPDVDHAPAFWSSVATAFQGRSNVLFDLFNEPFPNNNADTTAAWLCLRDGGSCPGVAYQAAGMQSLVNAVRITGATNILLVAGVQYASSLSQWSAYRPSDPQHQLAAAWHDYDGSACHDSACWNGSVAPVLAQVPLITGELGESDCAHGFIDPLMAWLDQHNASYLAWTWDTWDCGSGPALISSYDGTPTGFGAGYRDHLAAISPCTPAARAAITGPAGGTIGSSTATFQWAGGSCVTQYWLYAGSSPGVGDLYSSGPLPATATAQMVSGLPVDGRTLYVRLWSLVNGGWQAMDRGYIMGACNGPAKADITSPAGGSITTGTPTFQWGGGVCVTQYYLYIGNSFGSADLYAAGPLAATVTSATVSPAIPVDGRTIYVRLWSLVNGGWQAVDHSYLMGACQNGTKSDISSPTAGTLHGASQTFNWSSGQCVTQYWLYAGTAYGATDLFSSGSLARTVTSQTVTTLPADGSTVYLRLWSLVNGSWLAVDHAYVSAP